MTLFGDKWHYLAIGVTIWRKYPPDRHTKQSPT